MTRWAGKIAFPVQPNPLQTVFCLEHNTLGQEGVIEEIEMIVLSANFYMKTSRFTDSQIVQILK
ncbi:MAG: hypothetical protein ACYCTW_06605 [Sulfuricella sp.]